MNDTTLIDANMLVSSAVTVTGTSESQMRNIASPGAAAADAKIAAHIFGNC